MSTRMRWDRRRPTFEPWYARLDRDPFGREAISVRHSQTQAKPAKPKCPLVRVPLERPTALADALAPKRVLRTGHPAKAREALSSASEAIIWCDGSAEPNPGVVGAGAVILAGGIRVEHYGGGWRGTNNAAELEAAIMAIEVLPDGCRATVVGDSQYLILGMQKWRRSWRARGFKKNGTDIPNADRWRKLDAMAAGRSITWQWIRGHNGDAMNNLADTLAALGRTGGRA